MLELVVVNNLETVRQNGIKQRRVSNFKNWFPWNVVVKGVASGSKMGFYKFVEGRFVNAIKEADQGHIV